jgi:hypothetical protein
MELTERTKIQVRSNSVLLYNYPKESTLETMQAIRLLNLKSNEKRTYSGNVTNHAASRIKRAMNLLIQMTESKVVFNPIINQLVNHRLSVITLTIPDKTDITQREAYKLLLRPFLDWITKTQGVKHYIWKAELQKRGVLHYHIISPAFIRFDYVKDKWNTLILHASLMEDYKEKFNSITPPSTEIKEVNNANRVEYYLQKYVAKNDTNNRSVGGKVWDCSASLKGKKFFSCTFNEDVAKELVRQCNQSKVRCVDSDYISIIYFDKEKGKDVLPFPYSHLYRDYIKSLRDFEPPPKTRRIKPQLTKLEALTQSEFCLN